MEFGSEVSGLEFAPKYRDWNFLIGWVGKNKVKLLYRQ